MANPFQQAMLRRKIAYGIAIIALFTLSMFWRGKVPLPLADETRVVYLNQARRGGTNITPEAAPTIFNRAADWLSSRTIQEQARPEALDLRELEQGDAEISGSLLRCVLVGSRGVATTVTWRMAIEKQKRNEFHEFENLVRVVTRLQPNFITPWIYQSWNIAYNISVENDRLNDMYYYIARGIELLAEGERMNRMSPDMRFQIAFYYQNKFSVSDKVTTLRSLFQLSNVKHEDRNPARFRKDGKLDMLAFQTFVRKNPQLVRRLREKLGYTRPEQIVQFLEDNKKVPTRYDTRNDQWLPNESQFPALPPKPAPDEAGPRTETDDTFDAFLAARSWYVASREFIPPPPPDRMPIGFTELQGNDKFRYRVPKSPMLIIFRQGAARAQSYLAERLTKEGWFDRSTKWYPDERADQDADLWFNRGSGDSGFGEGLQTARASKAEWEKTYSLWKTHGEENGLQLDQATLIRFNALAQKVTEEQAMRFANYTDEQLQQIQIVPEQVKARNRLRFYEQNRQVTNFEFFLNSSEAEQQQDTVNARKLLWEAEQADKAADKVRAAEGYAKGLAAWRQVLLNYKSFHRSGSNQKAEEDTYEYHLALVRLIEQSPRVDVMARNRSLAIRGVIPTVDDDMLKGFLSREIAEREAWVLTAIADPRVQARADQILRESKTDPTLLAKYPSIAQGREAIVRELVERKDYEWLPEYMSDLKDDTNRWVRDEVRKGVRDRMRPSRPQPAATMQN